MDAVLASGKTKLSNHVLPRFIIVGTANTVLGLAIIYIARLLVDDVTANLIGYLLVVPVSFLTHRHWSFRDGGDRLLAFLRYMPTVATGYVLNLFILKAGLAIDLNPFAVQAVAIASYVMVTYLLSRFFVFLWPRSETPMSRLIPLPLMVLLATLIYRAPSRAASGIHDPDYYWHLAYGKWILDHLSLPTSDFWSWTANGRHYQLTQWLGEVVMALADRTAGEPGTQILAALLVTLTFTCSFLAARCYLGSRLASLIVAIGANITLLALACRPHLFSHLGLALLTWLVSKYQTSDSHRPLYWIPIVMAVWVNLHGGYAIGLGWLWIMTWLLFVERYIRHDESPWRAALPLALTAAAGTIATLLNPYGIGAWENAINVATLKSSAAGIIDEWNPTTIRTEAGFQFFIVSSALFASMATAREKLRPHALMAAFLLVGIGWTSLRVSIFASVLLVPLIAQAIRTTPFYMLAFVGRAYHFERGVKVVAAIPLLAALLIASWSMASRDHLAEDKMLETLPVRETEFIRAKNLTGKILNTPDAGGYLIHHGLKVSLDTRFDLYGDRPLFEFLFAQRGEEGWREYISRLNPDIVLIENAAALRQLLSTADDYRLVFEGTRYSVLIKKNDQPELPTLQPQPHFRKLLERISAHSPLFMMGNIVATKHPLCHYLLYRKTPAFRPVKDSADANGVLFNHVKIGQATFPERTHRTTYLRAMQRLQAFKFELRPNGEQQRNMRRLPGHAGSCSSCSTRG